MAIKIKEPACSPEDLRACFAPVLAQMAEEEFDRVFGTMSHYSHIDLDKNP